MFRYRIEFSKGQEVRFISHLELMRAFQRAMRRAQLPLAFSEGFNPQPRMSFASPLAVGVTSAKEYLDVELKEDLTAEQVQELLAQNLPPGLKVSRCAKVSLKSPALMSLVAAADYEVRVPLQEDIDAVESRFKELLNRRSIVIKKEGKKGLTEKELRPGIYSLEYKGKEDGWIKFTMRLKTGSQGNIRPDEVLLALKEIGGLPLEMELAVIHRTGLYVDLKGRLVSPMELA